MIIFGTKGITTTPEKGTFHCPRCGGTRDYRLKRVRRFFTLYFIPMIPLNKLGEYVECGACQGTYDPEILNYDPAEAGQQIQAIFFTAVKQVMIGILLADGVVDDEEVKILQHTYRELTNSEITEQDLREEIESIRQSGASPIELVRGLGPRLNDHGKEIVIKAAYAIAQADGSVGEEEIRLLSSIGDALELSRAHLRAILEEKSAGPPPLPA